MVKVLWLKTLNVQRIKINTTIEEMLEKALQLDENHIKHDIKTERISALN